MLHEAGLNSAAPSLANRERRSSPLRIKSIVEDLVRVAPGARKFARSGARYVGYPKVVVVEVIRPREHDTKIRHGLVPSSLGTFGMGSWRSHGLSASRLIRSGVQTGY